MLVVALFGLTVELRVALVIARLDEDWAVILGAIALVVKLRTEP